MRTYSRAILGALVPAALAACSGEETAALERARPVTVFALQETEPSRSASLTGSVEPYREADIGFDVPGRIVAVRDVGDEANLSITQQTEDGKVVFDREGFARLDEIGEEIAWLDDERYVIARDAARARLESAVAQHRSKVIDREQVATQDLASAQAQLEVKRKEVEAGRNAVDAARALVTLARQTLEREKRLLGTGAGTPDAVDRAQSRFDAAQATQQEAQANHEARERGINAQEAAVAKAKANIVFKDSEVQMLVARVREAEQDVANAEYDLRSCVLRAPFPGRVTKVHVDDGAFVAAGKPVVTLTLMHPVMVLVAVSGEQDRALHRGDTARLTYPDPRNPDQQVTVAAYIFEKGEVADAATRTFRLDLIVGNMRLRPPGYEERADAPLVKEILPAVYRYWGEGGALYVDRRCLRREGGAWYVYRIPGVKIGALDSARAVGAVSLQRIRVSPGDAYRKVGRMMFRSLADPGEVEERDMLAVNPPAGAERGVVLGRWRWALRPGDLIPVSIEFGRGPRGFYVPVHAVVWRGGQTFLYVVTEGRAREVEVHAHETIQGLRRVTSVVAGALSSGDRVVLEGAHYCNDRARVQVVAEELLDGPGRTESAGR